MNAIRDRGVGSLRIRDIASVAGVSTGTVHYHFDDLDAVLYEVHTLACDRFFADRMRVVAGVEDARTKLANMITTGLPASKDDAVVVALYEIDLYRRGDPVHELLGRALFDRQVALYFGILELGQSQGHFRLREPALDIAHNLVALEDAYGMHIILGNHSLPVARCVELIIGYARCATGCDELLVTW